ncbi:hypothetical protein CYLTODRAFT_484622 [Cylindrobasidium torrendii FP15055 ss-10]|uniref:Uncharacterized protein n=1 Tax=Cylindrobasidium torrendii FP15055 ss-10 TaxID=1314674 RepID=A0A0D7BXD7_9AGAR|nr:hypothetical protein CYLTODRAFT_484622 [Cylindrobasidium torrendii FP15055 ss-10]
MPAFEMKAQDRDTELHSILSPIHVVFIVIGSLVTLAVLAATGFLSHRYWTRRLNNSIKRDGINNSFDSEKALQNSSRYSSFKRLSLSSSALPSSMSSIQVISASSSAHSIPEQDIAQTHSRTSSASFLPASIRASGSGDSLSMQAGTQVLSRRARGDPVLPSESSSSMETIPSFVDSFAFQSIPGSSMTSFPVTTASSTALELSEDLSLLDEYEEYQVHRAQAQSVEIQRGVLVNCRGSSFLPALSPILEASEHHTPGPRFSQRLSVAIPSAMSKRGSLAVEHAYQSSSMPSVASSVSVDLSDFPLPPTA